MDNFSYFVVFIRYPRTIQPHGVIVPASIEAVVDPDISCREVLNRMVSGDYPIDRIERIHYIDGPFCEDVTEELMEEAEALKKEAA